MNNKEDVNKPEKYGHLTPFRPELAEKYLFTKDNQPVGRKTRKGVPNRASVVAKWLTTKVKTVNLSDEEIECSAADAVVLAQIRKAVVMGDTNAAVFLLGKAPDEKHEQVTEVKPLEDMSLLSDEELKTLAAINRKMRGLPPIEEGEYVPFTESNVEHQEDTDA